MRRDFDESGALGPGTAGAMWTCYGLAAAAYADALRHGRRSGRAATAAAGAVAASGLALTAAGAVARRSPVAMLLTAAYAGICIWWVRVEERSLERTFGDEYRRFKASTPRWLGRPRPRIPW